jgi:hypothetical protein
MSIAKLPFIHDGRLHDSLFQFENGKPTNFFLADLVCIENWLETVAPNWWHNHTGQNLHDALKKNEVKPETIFFIDQYLEYISEADPTTPKTSVETDYIKLLMTFSVEIVTALYAFCNYNGPKEYFTQDDDKKYRFHDSYPPLDPYWFSKKSQWNIFKTYIEKYVKDNKAHIQLYGEKDDFSAYYKQQEKNNKLKEEGVNFEVIHKAKPKKKPYYLIFIHSTMYEKFKKEVERIATMDNLGSALEKIINFFKKNPKLLVIKKRIEERQKEGIYFNPLKVHKNFEKIKVEKIITVTEKASDIDKNASQIYFNQIDDNDEFSYLFHYSPKNKYFRKIVILLYFANKQDINTTLSLVKIRNYLLAYLTLQNDDQQAGGNKYPILPGLRNDNINNYVYWFLKEYCDFTRDLTDDILLWGKQLERTNKISGQYINGANRGDRITINDFIDNIYFYLIETDSVRFRNRIYDALTKPDLPIHPIPFHFPRPKVYNDNDDNDDDDDQKHNGSKNRKTYESEEESEDPDLKGFKVKKEEKNSDSDEKKLPARKGFHKGKNHRKKSLPSPSSSSSSSSSSESETSEAEIELQKIETKNTQKKKASLKKETEKIIDKLAKKGWIKQGKNPEKLQKKLIKEATKYVVKDEYQSNPISGKQQQQQDDFQQVSQQPKTPRSFGYSYQQQQPRKLSMKKGYGSQYGLQFELTENASRVQNMMTERGQEVWRSNGDGRYFYIAKNRSRQSFRRVYWIPRDKRL